VVDEETPQPEPAPAPEPEVDPVVKELRDVKALLAQLVDLMSLMARRR
jgi:hypothetical protein